jgi:hypothetical protein
MIQSIVISKLGLRLFEMEYFVWLAAAVRQEVEHEWKSPKKPDQNRFRLG